MALAEQGCARIASHLDANADRRTQNVLNGRKDTLGLQHQERGRCERSTAKSRHLQLVRSLGVLLVEA